MLESNKILDFADFTPYSDTYIETGSCYGGSIQKALKAGFKFIKSVEVHPPFFDHCFELFSNNKNVELFLGRSDEEMPEMLKGISKPCVIFLDAHPAGPGTGGHDDLMEKGNGSTFHQDYILTKEIQAILKNNPKHVIIIDDQNGENAENKAYMKMISEVNPNYLFCFYDEQAGDKFYKNKSLVCIPT